MLTVKSIQLTSECPPYQKGRRTYKIEIENVDSTDSSQEELNKLSMILVNATINLSDKLGEIAYIDNHIDLNNYNKDEFGNYWLK